VNRIKGSEKGRGRDWAGKGNETSIPRALRWGALDVRKWQTRERKTFSRKSTKKDRKERKRGTGGGTSSDILKEHYPRLYSQSD